MTKIPTPTDPVDWGKRQPPALPPFILTVDGPALCELALRQNIEAKHAALLEITKLIQKRERENEAEEGGAA